jgi:hypothetical protein
MLTSQERSALSAALKTTLKLWGESEDTVQKRLQGKLQSIITKLEALDRSASTSGH